MKRCCGRSSRRLRANALIILFFLICGIGCAGNRPAQDESVPKADIETLLVIPFTDQAALHGENEIYRCGFCGGMYKTGAVEPGAGTLITEKVIRMVSTENTVRLVSNDTVEDLRMQLVQDPATTLTDLELAAKIGEALGADAVLTGGVYRWVDRVGSDYAADSPASVGFDIDLVESKTGRLIWHDRIDETQQFLIDNLLKIGTFLERGGRWVTAEEMAAAELKEVLERSPIP